MHRLVHGWLLYISTTINAENEYFDQGLECTAPKRWSKYITGGGDVGDVLGCLNVLCYYLVMEGVGGGRTLFIST